MARGLRPSATLTVSEWADKYRTLSGKAASEPGPWRTDRTPYLREVMDCLSPQDPAEEVVFMKGSQVGATEAGNNWLGYIIHHAPGPVMVVQPTVDTAKRNSRQRIDPLIEGCSVLKGLVSSPRSRDSGNTVLSKEFPGGILIMTGANSAVGLRSMPVRYLFADEIDAYPGDVDGEGDPLDLGIARTRTFSRRKIFEPSTPTIEGLSKIDAKFKDSDQRYFWVPCPHCQKPQTLKFAQLRWPKGEPESAVYVCEHCSAEIHNHDKTWMLERGKWLKKNPKSKIAGFHLSSLYSPVGWFSWADAAVAFDRAQKDPAKLKVFVNTILGETWAEKGDAPEWQRLYDRREDYPRGTCPRGALFLTAGVDVQKDRLEVQIIGWGRGKQSWSIDHIVLDGDPSRTEVWTRLSELIDGRWPHECGAELALLRVAVDSGYSSNDVYAWARTQGPGRVIVIKGQDRGAAPVGQPSAVDVTVAGKKIARGIKVWPVTVGIFKSELYGWLRLDKPTDESGASFPAGYCHHPKYQEEWFKQLTAEQLVTRVTKNKYKKLEWQQTRPRNEALDTFVYGRAAAAVVGIDRFREKHWRELERRLGIDETPEPVQMVSAPVPVTEVPHAEEQQATQQQSTSVAPSAKPPEPRRQVRRIRSRFMV